MKKPTPEVLKEIWTIQKIGNLYRVHSNIGSDLKIKDAMSVVNFCNKIQGEICQGIDELPLFYQNLIKK